MTVAQDLNLDVLDGIPYWTPQASLFMPQTAPLHQAKRSKEYRTGMLKNESRSANSAEILHLKQIDCSNVTSGIWQIVFDLSLYTAVLVTTKSWSWWNDCPRMWSTWQAAKQGICALSWWWLHLPHHIDHITCRLIRVLPTGWHRSPVASFKTGCQDLWDLQRIVQQEWFFREVMNVMKVITD